MMAPERSSRIGRWARLLKREIDAVIRAFRHPATPWYARLWLALVIAYALSPIDLIPDFIPVLGHLDDLILVPLGIWLALRLIPEAVMRECRAAAAQDRAGSELRWIGVAIVVMLWAGAIALVVIGASWFLRWEGA